MVIETKQFTGFPDLPWPSMFFRVLPVYFYNFPVNPPTFQLVLWPAPTWYTCQNVYLIGLANLLLVSSMCNPLSCAQARRKLVYPCLSFRIYHQSSMYITSSVWYFIWVSPYVTSSVRLSMPISVSVWSKVSPVCPSVNAIITFYPRCLKCSKRENSI